LGAGWVFNFSSYVITVHKIGTSAEAGIAYSMLTLLDITAGFSYTFMEKIFKKRIIHFAYVFMAAGLLFMQLITGAITGVYVGSALLGFGFFTAIAYHAGAIMRAAPSGMAAIAMSLMIGLNNGIRYVSPYILSFLGKLFGGGVTGALWVGFVIMAVWTVLAEFVFVQGDKPGAPTGA
jgi:hypothetical protein